MVCVVLAVSVGASAQAPDSPTEDGFRGIIRSPLIPLPQQAAVLRDYAWRYLETQAGAPIVVSEELKGDESATKDFWWSGQRYEQAAEIKDKKEREQVLSRLIGEHWIIAQPLLQSRYVDEKLIGIGLCVLAADCALNELKDANLAQALLESEVLPRIDSAPEEAWQFLSLDNILARLTRIYGMQNDKAAKDKLRRVYELRLSLLSSRDDIDYLRIQLAMMSDADGRPEEALKQLHLVSAPDLKKAAQELIVGIEAKQAEAKAKIKPQLQETNQEAAK